MVLKTHFAALLFIAFSINVFAQFSINKTPAISGTDSDLRGLDTIFIVEDLGSGLTLSYLSEDTTYFQWATFSVDGGILNFNPILGTMTPEIATSHTINSEGGYALLHGEIDFDTLFVWIVDYEQHKPQLDSLVVYDDYLHKLDSCNNVSVRLFSKTEQILVDDPRLLRNVSLTRYQKIEWRADPAHPDLSNITNNEAFVEYLPAPYDDTRYIATYRERFLSDASNNSYIGSEYIDTLYEAIAVNYTDVVGDVILRDEVNNEAEQDIGTNKELEGSAPLDVEFSVNGASTKVNYYEWSVWQHTDSNPSYIRYDSEQIRHEFLEPADNSDTQADYYVRLKVSNEFCEKERDSISVTILSSALDGANIFVLGWNAKSTEFKAVYKSIRPGTFRGDIFNRWGKRIFTWNDPERGWDGRVNGRYVSPGVYYYILTATGTDGQDLKVRRDLTILREKGLK